MKKLLFLSPLLLIISLNIQAQEKKEITLESIWLEGKFFPKRGGEYVHMKDGEHYCMLTDEGIQMYEYKSGNKVSLLVSSKDLKPSGSNEQLDVEDFILSPDESKVLLKTASVAIYRHSEVADYYVLDLTTKQLTPLSGKGKQQLPDFSPDGSMICFIRSNNMFLKDLKTGEEKQLTTDGKKDSIINGSTDWVYEEEFSFTKAFHWSPDGRYIAFLRFDESAVKQFSMTYYDGLYPSEYTYKYPKAGEDNSVVSVMMYDLKAAVTTSVLKKMETGSESDFYIPRIYWTSDPGTLAILHMNRLQNRLRILYADASTGKSSVVYEETNRRYIEIDDHFYFLKDNRILLLSERDGYQHIYTFTSDGRMERQLTKGQWDVTKILSVDEARACVYFQSAESSPLNREVCVVNFDGSGKKTLSKMTGWNDASFSKTSRYYFSTWADANTPFRIGICDNSGAEKAVIIDNAAMLSHLKNFAWPRKEFFSFTNSEGITLNGFMMKPASFSATEKYPVLLTVYGGPASQTVENNWDYIDMSYHAMMTQKGYVVVSVDGRGTGARGEEFRKCTYGRMGELETTDQVEAAKYMKSLPWVDAQRVGIWGWSFGGFISLLCMTKGAEEFKTGVAVAPVSSWRYYDNIYTERYMGLPADNAKGYDDNAPVKFASMLKGKLLIAHGATDDNVHLQNTMEMVNALIAANKQFEMQIYPNRNHNISGGYARYHLFKRITDFLLKNL
jgi:dipeptidyl-peptidase 4